MFVFVTMNMRIGACTDEYTVNGCIYAYLPVN